VNEYTILIRVMNLHVLLEIEEGKLVTLRDTKKLSKRGINMDSSAIFSLLELVILAILGNTLGDLSACNEFILA
tara:strand:- start:4 stop:225 length:222 start_codon:yes stop_codon:yes gene_type:complete